MRLLLVAMMALVQEWPVQPGEFDYILEKDTVLKFTTTLPAELARNITWDKEAREGLLSVNGNIVKLHVLFGTEREAKTRKLLTLVGRYVMERDGKRIEVVGWGITREDKFHYRVYKDGTWTPLFTDHLLEQAMCGQLYKDAYVYAKKCF